VTTDSTIGANLAGARARRGWTREALAFHSGVSWSAISQIESGRRREVRITTLAALARALGVTVDHLVASPNPAPPLLRHAAVLYDSDEHFLAATLPFMTDGIDRDEPLLAVVSKPRARVLRDALGDLAHGVTFEDAKRWYRTPVEALGRYRSYLDDHLATGGRWARVIGEPAVSIGSIADVDAWGRYEALFDVLFASAAASVLCPYDSRVMTKRVISHVRRTHRELASGDGPTANPDYELPERIVLGS
jgi:transcriptional regulator with XRE-family HTH domain